MHSCLYVNADDANHVVFVNLLAIYSGPQVLQLDVAPLHWNSNFLTFDVECSGWFIVY